MKKQYELLDRNNRLIWNFRDIGHTMRHISEGKGSQQRVLILLLESDGMTQKELTMRLGVQPGSASEVIGKLEKNGLIIRTESETDHRTMNLLLTEDGKTAAQQAFAVRKTRHENMFSALSDEEKQTLLYLLEKVNGDWDKKFRKKEEA